MHVCLYVCMCSWQRSVSVRPFQLVIDLFLSRCLKSDGELSLVANRLNIFI